AGALATTNAAGRQALPAARSDVVAILVASGDETGRQNGPWFSAPSLSDTPPGRSVSLSPDSPRADPGLPSTANITPPRGSVASALDGFFAHLQSNVLPIGLEDNLDTARLGLGSARGRGSFSRATNQPHAGVA